MSKVESILLGNGTLITKTYNSLGQLHSNDSPAIKTPFTEEWYRDGLKHRSNGYAVFINNPDYIRMEWWKDGKLHRDNNKPAIIDSDGNIEYWNDGNKV